MALLQLAELLLHLLFAVKLVETAHFKRNLEECAFRNAYEKYELMLVYF